MAKKALVVNEEFYGNAVGSIVRIDEASEIDGHSNHLRSKMDTVDVPVELEDTSVEDLEAVLVDGSYIIQARA